ncbi:MAG: hypothetical protein JWR69_3974 [Pedosphaera sp.]|nr:hypothetical protein [Pedosphaera sp.]
MPPASMQDALTFRHRARIPFQHRVLMDIKNEILKLQRTTADNPAIIVLVVVGVIAVLFVAIVLIDSFVRRKKRKTTKRAR